MLLIAEQENIKQVAIASGNSQQDAESVRCHDLVEMAIVQVGTNRKARTHSAICGPT